MMSRILAWLRLFSASSSLCLLLTAPMAGKPARRFPAMTGSATRTQGAIAGGTDILAAGKDLP